MKESELELELLCADFTVMHLRVKDQLFPQMAVEVKIICLAFSVFYGNVFL
jgi:hypothetical protein